MILREAAIFSNILLVAAFGTSPKYLKALNTYLDLKTSQHEIDTFARKLSVFASVAADSELSEDLEESTSEETVEKSTSEETRTTVDLGTSDITTLKKRRKSVFLSAPFKPLIDHLYLLNIAEALLFPSKELQLNRNLVFSSKALGPGNDLNNLTAAIETLIVLYLCKETQQKRNHSFTTRPLSINNILDSLFFEIQAFVRMNSIKVLKDSKNTVYSTNALIDINNNDLLTSKIAALIEKDSRDKTSLILKVVSLESMKDLYITVRSEVEPIWGQVVMIQKSRDKIHRQSNSILSGHLNYEIERSLLIDGRQACYNLTLTSEEKTLMNELERNLLIQYRSNCFNLSNVSFSRLLVFEIEKLIIRSSRQKYFSVPIFSIVLNPGATLEILIDGLITALKTSALEKLSKDRNAVHKYFSDGSPNNKPILLTLVEVLVSFDYMSHVKYSPFFKELITEYLCPIVTKLIDDTANAAAFPDKPIEYSSKLALSDKSPGILFRNLNIKESIRTSILPKVIAEIEEFYFQDYLKYDHTLIEFRKSGSTYLPFAKTNILASTAILEEKPEIIFSEDELKNSNLSPTASALSKYLNSLFNSNFQAWHHLAFLNQTDVADSDSMNKLKTAFASNNEISDYINARFPILNAAMLAGLLNIDGATIGAPLKHLNNVVSKKAAFYILTSYFPDSSTDSVEIMLKSNGSEEIVLKTSKNVSSGDPLTIKFA